jgi:hypothetical protein
VVVQQLADSESVIVACFEIAMTTSMSYFHSIETSAFPPQKNQKMEIEPLAQQCEKNVKIETRDLHHQLQQEVETAPHSMNDK